MESNLQTGNRGESLAAAYFMDKGYEILHRNWRHKKFEVDIIASCKGILHFIEVKTRTTLKFGYPEENVNSKKIRMLIDASEAYLYVNPQWQRIQFDVLSVLLEPGKSPGYFLIEDIYL